MLSGGMRLKTSLSSVSFRRPNDPSGVVHTATEKNVKMVSHFDHVPVLLHSQWISLAALGNENARDFYSHLEQ